MTNTRATRPADSTPTPAKRASPKPSAETEALRALRKLRELTEREAKTFRAYHDTRNECTIARAAINDGLSDGARAILSKLDGDSGGGA